MREDNLKPSTRANTIDRLSRLSLFQKNKSFREMTTEEFFAYLDSIRRTESADPMHKWVGTYNLSIAKFRHYAENLASYILVFLSYNDPRDEIKESS